MSEQLSCSYCGNNGKTIKNFAYVAILSRERELIFFYTLLQVSMKIQRLALKRYVNYQYLNCDVQFEAHLHARENFLFLLQEVSYKY